MNEAVSLAKLGLGSTYPNPSVGAVIVRGQDIVGRGRTAPTGGPHAEVRALTDAGERARGATMYVTLEPCAHVGRTGPCSVAIAEAGIAKVVIGIRDPAEHVSGKGVEDLRRRGVEVVIGEEAQACVRVHEHYLHHLATRRPFVTLKSATSMDGFIATKEGRSQWITGELARAEGHRLRAQYHAIAVGVGTVLADNPRLDVRHVEGTDPVVVVIDSRLRLLESRHRLHVLRPGTLVLHTPFAASSAVDRMRESGAESVCVASDEDGRVDLGAALDELGRRQIRSLVVEGGGQLLSSFVHHDLWNRWHYFVAPRLFGQGTPVAGGVVFDDIESHPRFRCVDRRWLGDDLLWVLQRRADAEA